MKYKTTYFRLSIDENINLDINDYNLLVHNSGNQYDTIFRIISSLKLEKDHVTLKGENYIDAILNQHYGNNNYIDKKEYYDKLFYWFKNSFHKISKKVQTRILNLMKELDIDESFDDYFSSFIRNGSYYITNIQHAGDKMTWENKILRKFPNIDIVELKNKLIKQDNLVLELLNFYGFNRNQIDLFNIIIMISNNHNDANSFVEIIKEYNEINNVSLEQRYSKNDEDRLNEHLSKEASEGWRLHSMNEINRAVSDYGGLRDGGYGYGYTIQEGFVMVWEKE